MATRPELLFTRQRGFALIVTVVLVAFLVLILVGLATFTRVETQVAENTGEVAGARQNALAALNIALGQLQEQAGPDERVTARSDLVGGVGAGNQAYFTGVWDTSSGAPDATPDAWLVSGTEGSAAANDTGGIADPAPAVTSPFNDAADTVFLVYNASVGSDNAIERGRRVNLRKQPITAPASALPGFASTDTSTPTIGHYAYWVGDEGVKVSVAVTEPDLATLNYNNTGLGGDNWANAVSSTSAELGSRLRDRLAQFAQPHRRIDEFYPGIDYTVGTTPDQLSRVTGIEQLLFVTNSVASAADRLKNFKARYHDMTTIARGVLARTDAGAAAGTDRLRRDWSARVAPVAAGTSSINDYWLLRPASVSAAAGTFSAVYGIKARKTSAGTGLAFSVAPVLSEAGLFVDVGDNGGQLVLRTGLLAEFWNPYAATLRTETNATLKLVVRTRSGGSALVFRATDSAGTPVVHTMTVPAGTVIAEAEVPAAQDFTPGEILHMQTTSTGVFATSGAGARNTTFGSGTAPTLPITSVDLPAVPAGDLIFELQENSSGAWVTLQTFAPAARDAESGVSPGTPYTAGYGFELNRDLLLWSDPRATGARDPRAPDFVAADHFEPLPSATATHWDQDASTTTNPGNLAGEGPLENGASLVLFDLPRQEITTVAQLRHLAGSRPYEIMLGTGASDANDQSIFDATFVSTVPGAPTAWNFATQARPNRYLEVFVPERAPAGEFDTDANRLTSLRDDVISARFQLIRGSFNINSTSVAAWSAVLGSSLNDWDTHTDAVADVNRAFFRTPHGAQEKGLANLVITDVTADDPDAPAGADLDDASALTAVGRRLTPDEIDDLAQEIVDALIARGRPFASLAEFVGSTLLTNAIAAAGLNGDITTASYRHSAGAITPGDIVSAIAPFMAARSDTFKIRAYGDVVNPINDVVITRAWCEAIVQRVPDLAPSPGDPNAAAASAATVVRGDPAVYSFGRQFKIVSFRWLSPDNL